MRVYSERLGVPASWWLVVMASVALLGTTLWAGLSVTAAIVIYAGLASVSALVLLAWGAATIEVTGTGLRAGSQRLPLERIGSVTALNAAQTRALRGPRADPAAYMLVRPYLPDAVYVAVAGRPAGRPYWLIGTRKPAELAAAIERAAAAQPSGAETIGHVAEPDAHAAEPGSHADGDGAGHAAPGIVG